MFHLIWIIIHSYNKLKLYYLIFFFVILLLNENNTIIQMNYENINEQKFLI
jgi:hypothetical protein